MINGLQRTIRDMASEMKRLERSAAKDEKSDMNKMSFSALPGMTEATS